MAVLSVALCLLAFPEPDAGAQGAVLVGTVAVGGQVEPYQSMSGDELGGLAHRIGYLNALANAGSKPLFVDAGGGFFADATVAQLTPDPSIMTAMFIAKMYEEMRAVAVNVGPSDLAFGLDFLEELVATYETPFVSANLTSTSGTAVFDPYRMVSVDGVNVLVTGLWTSTEGSAISRATGYQAVVQDPARALRSVIQSAGGQADWIVLMSQLSPSEELSIAQAFPTVDLILSAPSGGSDPGEESVGDVRILRIPPRGGAVGTFDLEEERGEIVWLDTAEVAADPESARTVEEFLVELHEKCGC
ncbi:bifunctional UDP-sugar hydrolase/5'-nucleotidase [Limnochorda pilosa]|uniref:5'-nucleotidase n=1 Tax=Limnochorda pilosa TaxID=1555112 RepID=A0A0K2SHC7_LIMPI|nr:hypothetical protein [Limnochorda pilosa]BAS26214.1 hypothetical protein LIP_0357 [Limnochorda pilosa]